MKNFIDIFLKNELLQGIVVALVIFCGKKWYNTYCLKNIMKWTTNTHYKSIGITYLSLNLLIWMLIFGLGGAYLNLVDLFENPLILLILKWSTITITFIIGVVVTLVTFFKIVETWKLRDSLFNRLILIGLLLSMLPYIELGFFSFIDCVYINELTSNIYYIIYTFSHYLIISVFAFLFGLVTTQKQKTDKGIVYLINSNEGIEVIDIDWGEEFLKCDIKNKEKRLLIAKSEVRYIEFAKSEKIKEKEKKKFRKTSNSLI